MFGQVTRYPESFQAPVQLSRDFPVIVAVTDKSEVWPHFPTRVVVRVMGTDSSIAFPEMKPQSLGHHSFDSHTPASRLLGCQFS
jgi:hypothetical protein